MTDLYNIPDSDGGTFLNNLNAGVQSLVKRTRRASAFPDTIYAGMLWDDSTNGVVWRRSQSGVWKPESAGANTIVQARASNTILGLGDHATKIVATGTFTQTFTAAATLTDGWWVEYRNGGTGRITLDPNGAEQIDGATTIVVEPGEGMIIRGDGAALSTTGRATGLKLLQTLTASASAALNFTQGFDASYDKWLLHLTNFVPSTNNVDLWLRISEDGGGTWKSGATNYVHARHVSSSAAVATPLGSNGDSKILLAAGIPNTSGGGGGGWFEIMGLSVSGYKYMNWKLLTPNNDGNIYTSQGGGVYTLDSNAINGLQLSYSSGNIATGVAGLYAMVK